MKHLSTPLYDQLILHQAKDPISLHVPGHKNGSILWEQKYFFFHELLKLDVTELTDLDDLHSPEGIIREAEELLTDLYHTKRSYFLVNGSTVGNLAMIMATLEENDLVFVQRNSHKSVLNGIELAGAKAIFLDPDYNNEWQVAGGLSAQIVKQAFDLYPNAKAIILTYPNYYGMVNQLSEIIKMAHNKKVPVLVDEAHGAHFISGGSMPLSAVQLGADIVVQSAHKTLPAMTMGSYLHVNSSFISQRVIEKYLYIFQSSSPSYPIMASLDIARKYLATYTMEDYEYLQEQIWMFRTELKQLGKIKILDYKGAGDVLKITIQSENELSGYEMQILLEEKGIYTEMADPNNVLFVLPLLKKGMRFPFYQIVAKIKEALQPIKKQKRNIIKDIYVPTISKLELDRKDFKRYRVKQVPIMESIGEIAAEPITPYPPGIPILLPGERITAAIAQQIHNLVEVGARFQGNGQLDQLQISIFNKGSVKINSER